MGEDAREDAEWGDREDVDIDNVAQGMENCRERERENLKVVLNFMIPR